MTDTDRKHDRKTTLIIGFGNPGRCDDGLGPIFAERIAALELPGVTVESNYQLNVEDARQIAEYDTVIFADASVAGEEPFSFQPVAMTGKFRFSTHSVSPETVLALARQLYHADTQGFTLGIRGYRYNDFDESLSDAAAANLEEAVRFVETMIREAGCPDIDPSNSTEPASAGRWCHQ